MKRCLVLGGSGSIGSAICRALVREGAQLAFTYHRSESVARQLERETGAVAAACDLRDDASRGPALRALIGAIGGVDALISAVGFPGEPFDLKLRELTPQDIDARFQVNARGVLLACQDAASHANKMRGGNIVILGSLDGVKTVPSPISFALAKSALRGMAEAMSKELGDLDIKVNVLALGIVEGGASRSLPEDLKQKYVKHSSAKRLAKPAEIAEVAAWFALENTYVTGQSIVLNGGL